MTWHVNIVDRVQRLQARIANYPAKDQWHDIIQSPLVAGWARLTAPLIKNANSIIAIAMVALATFALPGAKHNGRRKSLNKR